MRRAVLVCSLALGALLALEAAAEVTTVTLAFQEACLDLDTGTVEDLPAEAVAEQESCDLIVTYNADRGVHAVLLQNERLELEVAHLTDRTFADVTTADVAGAPFTTDRVDEPFDAGRVLLIRTDLGAVFKLGNASEDEDGVTFDSEQL